MAFSVTAKRVIVPGRERDTETQRQLSVLADAVNTVANRLGRPVFSNTLAVPGDTYLLADASAGAMIVTLPLAKSAYGPIGVKKVDASANAVEVRTTGAETIDNANATSIGGQYEHYIFVSDGVNRWWIF